MRKGFIDLQVNGFLGIDFSEIGLQHRDVQQVTRALRQRGTIAYCPTLITSSHDVYESNLPVLAKAMEDPELAPHLLGIHLEGPFLSPKEGARGAHPAEHMAAPNIEQYEHLRELAGDRVSLVTVAPERTNSGALICHILKTGAVVSMGHTLASLRQIKESCDLGVRASTHLGNGLPNSLPRHPNPIWDQLAEERLTAMVITDGHHVPDSFIKVVARVKGAVGFLAVSDSAPVAGCPPGTYKTLGQQVVLESSGRLWNPIGNHLVGSSSCMLECMNHLAGLNLFSTDELWQVGYQTPLSLLGRTLNPADYETFPEVFRHESRFQISSQSAT